MARAIWSGALSFGLINIPVEIMSAEKRTDLRFHLVDSRDQSRVRYERVNAETGEEVPWKDIAKAFEYQKGSYVVFDEKDFKEAAPESAGTIDIEGFIDMEEIGPEYFERPYFLIPGKKADKGYVLLRETLKQQKKVGIARVVIRTREHLTMLLSRGDALMLMVLRYPQELVVADTYAFPDKASKTYRITPKEIEMARQLVDSMSSVWQPKNYRDEFREKLAKMVALRVKKKGGKLKAKPAGPATESSGKVVDFMALLKKSIDTNRRTPAKRATSAKTPIRRKTKKTA